MRSHDSTASQGDPTEIIRHEQSATIPSAVGRESDYPTMPELVKKPDRVLIY